MCGYQSTYPVCMAEITGRLLFWIIGITCKHVRPVVKTVVNIAQYILMDKYAIERACCYSKQGVIHAFILDDVIFRSCKVLNMSMCHTCLIHAGILCILYLLTPHMLKILLDSTDRKKTILYPGYVLKMCLSSIFEQMDMSIKLIICQ